jgi:peroxiredoxin
VKLSYLAIPLGLALACAGGLMMVLANQPHVIEAPIISSEPRHLVTAKMMEVASGWLNKEAPDFAVKDYEGNPVALGGESRARPQFLYFIKDGCPCSIDVEPLFHDLHKRFGKKIDFVGVIDKGDKSARQWSTDMKTNYPIVPDEAKAVIHAYGATNSAFSLLIGKEGKILKMWPGYSVDLLQDMNQNMAVSIGEEPKPFDTRWAPKIKAAGCAF